MRSLLRNIRAGLRSFLQRKEADGELDEELREFMEMAVREKMKQGIERAAAVRAVRLERGSLELNKEVIHSARWESILETYWRDVRYGLRMLRKNPGFTAIAVLTLALGIGANTAIFSIVQGVLLAPLPYHDPGRLIVVWESNPRFPRVGVSYPNFRDRQRMTKSFEQVAAFATQGYDLTGHGMPEHFDGKEVSANAFSTLGVRPALGHEFLSSDDMQGGSRVVVISDRVWRERFGGNPDALGKSLTLNGVDYTIIGILPSDFRLWDQADVFTLLGQGDPNVLGARGGHWLLSIGRLKPGVTIAQAQAETSAVQVQLDRLYPDENRDLGIALVPLKQQLVGDVRPIVLLLFGAVGLVLLIATANVGTLLLARSAVRSSEFAVRSALGANRARIVRQLLTESSILSFAGGAVGVPLAVLCLKPIVAIFRDNLPRSENIHLSIPVLLFTVAVSVAVGIMFGLAPAWRTSRTSLQAPLSARSGRFASSSSLAQNALVVVQMALTLVLLAGAGLLLRTIRDLSRVNPGFDAQHLITFRTGVPDPGDHTAAGTRVAYQQLIEHIRRIPGVEAADFTNTIPLAGEGGTMPFWIGSQRPLSLQAAPRLVGFLTGPDYFETMGIPLIEGRLFNMEDTVNSPCVVVIDRDFVQTYFKGSNPIGQTLTFGFASTPPCQIVGVVGHVKDSGLEDSAAVVQNQVYFPMYQDPDKWVADNYSQLKVVVRTKLDAESLIPTVEKAVSEAGSGQPVYDVRTMSDVVSDSMSTRRFPMVMLACFAALALLLASVGIYGVVSYSVAQCTREIGIRMALGASRRNVLGLTIGHGLKLAMIGSVLGIVGALGFTRLLSGLLYRVKPDDPLTFVTVSCALIGIAALACYLPARRAMGIDPMVALRHE
jgi:predicted permease